MNARSVLFGAPVALFVIGAGFDRFDLLGGGGGFSITPSILLTPVVIVGLVVALRSRRRSTSTPAGAAELRRYQAGAVLITGFVVAACVSVLFADSQVIAFRRILLLATIVAGASATIILERLTGTGRALRVGAWLGLLLTLLVDAAQVQAWFSIGPALAAHIGPVYVTSPTYGLFAPRPSGLSLDPNRGAFLVSIFYWLLTVDPWTRDRRMRPPVFVLVSLIAGLAVLGSFSRTGIVVFTIVLAAAIYKRLGLGGMIAVVSALVGIVSVGGLITLSLLPGGAEADLGQLLAERASFSGGESGGIHFELFSVGYQILALHPLSALVGIGFGNSPDFLQSIFAGTTAGNFHSLFLTALVELGAVGLVVVLAMLLLPLRTTRVVLAAVTCGFNVLYQADLDASFWLVVALLWLAPAAATSAPETVAQPGKVRQPAGTAYTGVPRAVTAVVSPLVTAATDSPVIEKTL